MKLKYLVTANDRLLYLIDAMKAVAAGAGSSAVDLATEYQEQIVPSRNKLAHVVSKRVRGKQILEGPEGKFTEEEMTKLRCELVKHRKNFKDVAVIYDVPLE